MSRDDLVKKLTAPGTAAGVTLDWLATRPNRRGVSIGAIAAATGEPPRRIAWGITVLRALGQLPAGIKVAPKQPAPCQNLASLTNGAAAGVCSGSFRSAPSAPPASVRDPEVSPRATPEQRQQANSAIASAAAWLLTTLAKRPLRARDVRAQAAAAGHAWRTLQRARILVGVEARVRGCDGGVWYPPAARGHGNHGAVPPSA